MMASTGMVGQPSESRHARMHSTAAVGASREVNAGGRGSGNCEGPSRASHRDREQHGDMSRVKSKRETEETSLVDRGTPASEPAVHFGGGEADAAESGKLEDAEELGPAPGVWGMRT